MAGDVAIGDKEGFIGSDGMGWGSSEECFGEEEDNEDIEDGKINATKVLSVRTGEDTGCKSTIAKILGNRSTDNWSEMRTIR